MKNDTYDVVVVAVVLRGPRQQTIWAAMAIGC